MFNKNKIKIRQAILRQQHEIKEDHFDFERIGLYYQNINHKHCRQLIDDRNLSDLDFEELFAFLDRTSSVVGQQYLYDTLRTIPANLSEREIFDRYADHLNGNYQLKDETIILLHQLNDPGAYYLQRLFSGLDIQKPSWIRWLPFLSVLTLLSFAGAFFYPPLFLAALLLASANTLIHYWNKNQLMGYANSIPQLLTLLRVAGKMHTGGVFIEHQEAIKRAIDRLKNISSSATVLKWESQASGDLSQVSEFVLDFIKGIFLIEPIVFYRLLDKIKSRQDEIRLLFEAVGTVDVSLSIDTWRSQLPAWCLPVWHTKEKIWKATGIFHPLISDPVVNELSVAKDRSVLLSGSNMSGKTTFIRTMGINTLLAQTINTVCASRFEASPLTIHSAIRIADDLTEDTSYYYEEVKTVKKLISAMASPGYHLILLDELFKGTNTIERIASGKAILSHLHGPTTIVCCSTHDLELIDYLHDAYDNYHFSGTVSEGELLFDYRLKHGKLDNTNAIRILEINDFPKSITEEAKEIAGRLRGER